jgi:hypothetical protein
VNCGLSLFGYLLPCLQVGLLQLLQWDAVVLRVQGLLDAVPILDFSPFLIKLRPHKDGGADSRIGGLTTTLKSCFDKALTNYKSENCNRLDRRFSIPPFCDTTTATSPSSRTLYLGRPKAIVHIYATPVNHGFSTLGV